MPQDGQGRPYEILANPLGIISRTNPGQVIEAAFGKIAEKTGRPYVYNDFSGVPDLTQHAMDELKKHNLTGFEEIVDPRTNRKIPNVFTGNAYFMKLVHTSEAKDQGRGLGGYTAENLPAKGGVEGSKKMALMDVHALLSHGALDVLRDAKLIRGQKNQEYWATFMAGNRPPTPSVPIIYDKFINQLRGAGINVTRQGSKINVMSMTNSDIDELTGDRAIQNPETVDWKEGMAPIKGGLFDPALTGSHTGSKWSHIKLHEAMPSPVMEDPIRRLLGLTQEGFNRILSGEEQLDGKNGPQAIGEALSRINVDAELNKARADIASGRKTLRDKAIQRLKYLKMSKDKNIHPREWMLSKVPVLPPVFRPVSIMQGTGGRLVNDANFLYKEVFDANEALKKVGQVSEDVGHERLTLYNAFKAVVGLGDPVQPKNQERQVKGLLANIFGSSGKWGVIQQKLLGTTVDMVGRAVVVPNPDLNMDEIGLPENRAWTVYTPFVTRRLVRRGVSRMQAMQYVKDRHDIARSALLEEIAERPVILTRAPVLHRYGLLAFWPKLVKGDTLHVSPPVVGGLGMDFDGDKILNTVLAVIPSAVYDMDVGKFSLTEVTNTMSARMKETIGFTNDRGHLVICHLSEFPHGEHLFTKGHIDFHAVPAGVKVVAYDERTNRPVIAPVSTWSKHHQREVWIVTLSSRRQIITDDDPRAVYGIDAATLEWCRRRPSEAAYQFVPVLDKSELTDAAELSTVALPRTYIPRGGELLPEFSLNTRSGYFWGLMAGDGWAARDHDVARSVCLASSYPGVQQAWKDSLSEFFAVQPIVSLAHITDGMLGESIGSERLQFGHVDFAAVVDSAVGHGAHHKHLPPFVWSSPRDFRLGVLAGLFDSDGSLCWVKAKAKKNRQFQASISSTSVRLIQEAQQLLFTLGVSSSISGCTHNGAPAYILAVSSVELRELGNLPLAHPEKKTVLEEFLASPANNIKRSTYARHRLVPLPSALANELSKLIKQPDSSAIYTALRRSAGSLDNQFMTQLLAQEALDILQKLGRNCTHPLFERWTKLVRQENMHLERVLKVENTHILEDGYDLSVPGYETFMSVDGVVLSNTSNYHIPASDEARDEAVEKLLPSKNLLSASRFKVHYLPRQEYVGGIYAATATKNEDRKPRTFATKKDALRAFYRGELDPRDPVEIVDESR